MPPPSKSSQQSDVLLALDFRSASRHVFANQFEIDYENGYFITHFSYRSFRGAAAPAVSVCLSLKALADQEDSILGYRQQVAGINMAPKCEWVCRELSESVIPADVCQLARMSNFAETSFFFASTFQAIEEGKKGIKASEKGNVLQSKCVLIVRSSLDLQIQWITQLYDRYINVQQLS